MGLFSNKKTSTSVSNQTENLSSVNDAAGTVGDVFQGQELQVNDYFSPEVAQAFENLTKLTGNAIDSSFALSGESIDSIKELTEAVKQPDLTLIQGYQKQVYYAIGGVALVLIILFLSKK